MKAVHKSIHKPSPKPLKTHPRNDSGKASNKTSKIPPTLWFGDPMLGHFAQHFAAPARFFRNLFFGTFRRHPHGRFWNARMKQKDIKRSQNGAQKHTKMKEHGPKHMPEPTYFEMAKSYLEKWLTVEHPKPSRIQIRILRKSSLTINLHKSFL